ncbi:putative signal peptide protein [Puccinia sorghi]|uniref:Putative signal peptide protein n=1 Tax=Puccinia sorghi TaxID=27349 RepID=A0A0L6UEU9_9BASI|nr:putative signal peptide protein [Puccinia sorghi]
MIHFKILIVPMFLIVKIPTCKQSQDCYSPSGKGKGKIIQVSKRNRKMNIQEERNLQMDTHSNPGEMTDNTLTENTNSVPETLFPDPPLPPIKSHAELGDEPLAAEAPAPQDLEPPWDYEELAEEYQQEILAAMQIAAAVAETTLPEGPPLKQKAALSMQTRPSRRRALAPAQSSHRGTMKSLMSRQSQAVFATMLRSPSKAGALEGPGAVGIYQPAPAAELDATYTPQVVYELDEYGDFNQRLETAEEAAESRQAMIEWLERAHSAHHLNAFILDLAEQIDWIDRLPQHPAPTRAARVADFLDPLTAPPVRPTRPADTTMVP